MLTRDCRHADSAAAARGEHAAAAAATSRSSLSASVVVVQLPCVTAMARGARIAFLGGSVKNLRLALVRAPDFLKNLSLGSGPVRS